MSLTTILLIVLIVFLLGGVPLSAANWGPYPASGLGLVLVILIILLLLGRIG